MGSTADFLDLAISKGTQFLATGYLDIEVFQKTLNKYLYLPPTSFHARHIFKSFITGEIKRYRLRCTSDDSFQQMLDKFYIRLRQRGHKHKAIAPLFANPPHRALLLQQVAKRLDERNQKSKAPSQLMAPPALFKTTWNIRFTKMNLKNCFAPTESLVADKDYNAMFKNRPPVLCFKRAANLKDKLTSAKHSLTTHTS
jgi:hypothetical protein